MATNEDLLDEIARCERAIGRSDPAWDEFPLRLKAADEARAAVLTRMGSGWQPIETAPRDGTVVLLYRPGFTQDVVTAQWSSDFGAWAVGIAYLDPFHFSAWLPLPAPPTDRTEGERT